MKKIKVPKFKNEDAERAFWAKVDLSKALKPKDFDLAIFPNLQPTSKPISLRIPSYLLARLKENAHDLDVPYQSLIKKYIAQGVKKG